ncbi:MAG: YggS family pyridoxal phosphate-dependent enzyme, partial [Pyrinomonadaceae bacterium]
MAEELSTLQTLRERYENVRKRVEVAARQCNRSPDEITLIAISKTHPVETLKAAISLGMTDLGENRVQEAEEKIVEVGRQSARWHLVGHLQANKARRAVSLFEVVHSLDSVSLTERLERLCVEEGREELPVLIQIDLGGEKSKTGIDPHELPQ